MTIFFYLARNFIKTFLIVLSFILALILIIDGIDQYGVVKGLGASLLECLIYVVIRVPTNIYQFLPLIILISALNFFLNLAKHSELVALRASGVSASRIVFVPVLMAFLIGVLATTIFDPVLVGSRNMTESYSDSFNGRSRQIVRTVRNGVWLREVVGEETRFIYIPGVKWKDQSFRNFEIFIKSPSKDIQHILAKSGRINKGKWVLNSPSFFSADSEPTSETPKRIWLPTNLTFDNIFASFSDPKRIKLINLPDFINNLERDGYDIKKAKTYFYSERFSPVFLMLMTLVGSIFALAPLRGGGTGLRSVAAISTGFLLFGITKLTESMAKAGDVPVFIGVAIIPIAGILLAISLLLHQEDG